MVRYTRKGLLKGEGNMGFLTGKTAIITGAGRAVLSDGRCGSIGYGIATAYAKEGANLVITGRNVQKLTDAKEELERLYGIKVLPVQADVSAGADNKAVVDNVVKQAIDTFGLFFASTFWRKMQNIFGECCISKLEKVAKP